MQDYEKMGIFYLGKTYDMKEKKLLEDLTLIKSKDLTTHAAIIGMTGSGKTGLGVALMEEAAMDKIPVIAIDPKGDLSNLALTFPDLSKEDFMPWVSPSEAANKGMDPEAYAKAQADLWRKGLADWGQDPQRIQQMRNNIDIRVYTPGSSAGIGVQAVRSFEPPLNGPDNDPDGYREQLQTTVTGVLTLVGMESDPLTGKEHILLASIMDHYWRQGRGLTMEELIGAVQNPPLEKVGVLDMESFYPSKERFELAMKINNLLASPGFQAWMEGDPLSIPDFLHNEEGKPRISVFSIAHLSDRERMFFVTMLLNELVGWMRTQSGTGSLRAILYMDELFGYLPPTANPPSKTPLLTLLKQARAFGLGLILSTQNPVDLDYKALSNIGTWFIGRLQTERDKDRVLAGLEGAASGGVFNKQETEQLLAGLGQRTFYLHSVHENEPEIFQTRWVMSYLAGPMTPDQIRNLPLDQSPKVIGVTSDKEDNMAQKGKRLESSQEAPVLDPTIPQFFQYTALDPDSFVYEPVLVGIGQASYNSTKYKVAEAKEILCVTPIKEGPVPVDWNDAYGLEEPVRLEALEDRGMEGASFDRLNPLAANPKNLDKWKKLFVTHVRTNMGLKLWYDPQLKMVSRPEEEQRDFLARLQHAAHEERDLKVEALRQKYESKFNTLQDRQRRALQAVEKSAAQSKQKKMDAVVSAGSALLGALFGKKKLTATSVSKIGTAMKSTGRAFQSGDSIEQAQENLAAVEQQIQELEARLQKEVDNLMEQYEAAGENLEQVDIRATGTNITVHQVGILWMPVETV
ncbi:DUF87 domain-containing protein [Alkalibacter rhizosphaerae]|uniref:DUF87 domain-containing protein n=1 Tax=Alkalibacter rhizosphaerae TaxID=2815577 RepID=A0A974XGL3_9FIRM|nr:DUF87 domain-containing protein [Alkalibacter rhizosphaerae]QSX09401.1 DUF87 domain-containing protein [Alkalibacter rhizosphaerae]